MEEIEKQFRRHKPELTMSSLRTYGYVVRRLLRAFDLPIEKWRELEKKQPDILKLLDTATPSNRKTTLAVLISLFGNKTTESLRKQMNSDSEDVANELKQQKKTPKQQKNWESWSSILKLYRTMYAERKSLLDKIPADLTQLDFIKLNELVMMALYTQIPPRRSSDYCLMKIKNYDTHNDNYYDNKQLVFNKFKTTKVYGTQKVKPSRSLQTLLRKWVKINPTDYMLFDTNKQPLTPSRMTSKFNNIFGKNISTSLLRHIYITDVVLKDAPKRTELEKTAKMMGHSVDAQADYRVT